MTGDPSHDGYISGECPFYGVVELFPITKQ
jgi:hypothetical protein